MVRSSAQENLDRIFRKATHTRLVWQAEDMYQIGTVIGGDSVNDEEVLILIIPSIASRLLSALRFDESDATHTYFAGEGVRRPLEEVRLEIGNLYCGVLNQELLQVFPDPGISTPYVVSARYLSYLDVFKPGYVAAYVITINDMVRVDTTVRVCAHAPLDFVADMNDEVESGGELELFRFGSLRMREAS